MLEAEDKSTPWQRILWLKQDGYPDNFLDESFLENLQRNVNVRQYTYTGLVLDTLPVTQHLCSIMVFTAAFAHIYSGNIGYRTLLGSTCASAVIGYGYWRLLARPTLSSLSSIASAIVLSAILLLLSPILQTLSKATTSDSIWPLSGCLFLLNAFLTEYGPSPAGHTTQLHFPSALSLNAAVCASAVLSSRLASHLDVFALMLFSIEWFALLPIFRKAVQRSLGSTINCTFTACVAFLGAALLHPLSTHITAIYLLALAALQFGMPLWLLNLQSLKNEVRGPWDVAVPNIDGKPIVKTF